MSRRSISSLSPEQVSALGIDDLRTYAEQYHSEAKEWRLVNASLKEEGQKLQDKLNLMSQSFSAMEARLSHMIEDDQWPSDERPFAEYKYEDVVVLKTMTGLHRAYFNKACCGIKGVKSWKDSNDLFTFMRDYTIYPTSLNELQIAYMQLVRGSWDHINTTYTVQDFTTYCTAAGIMLKGNNANTSTTSTTNQQDKQKKTDFAVTTVKTPWSSNTKVEQLGVSRATPSGN